MRPSLRAWQEQRVVYLLDRDQGQKGRRRDASSFFCLPPTGSALL